ncbi:ABC transporter substrate-binding protein [Nonomuraea sp. ZG12]|uniref:ABC transporter substrate-binding protein n=1 Tax=Nonomuraea sp. ZG12 TaxID=3452207 RepID=UPI003F8B6C2C
MRFVVASAIGTAFMTAVLTALADTAGLPMLGVLVGSVVIAYMSATILSRWWSSGTFKYSWFRKQPYIRRGPRDHLAGYMRKISEQVNTKPDLTNRLLVHAFLQDLRIAYRRRPFWPGWARSSYSVLILHDVRPGTAGWELITAMHDIVVRTGEKAPLLVVAAAPELSAELDAHAHSPVRFAAGEESLEDVYGRWRDQAGHTPFCPYFSVRDDGPADQPRPKPLVTSRRPALAHWVVTGLVALAPFAVPGWAAFSACETPLVSTDDQCIGLTDSYDDFDPALRPILERIVELNQEVRPGDKVFRVVYFGALTVKGGPDHGRQLVGAAAELVGVLARQSAHNEQNHAWKMYVEFANSGQDHAHAEIAAGQIVRRAERDDSIAAVVGLGWSRVEVQRAIELMGAAQIPMISSTATADRVAMLGESRSPYFFRLPPSNAVQAMVTAHWLRLGLPGHDGTELPPDPPVAVIWQKDAKELYSNDLADRFSSVYTGRYKMYDFHDGQSLQVAVRKACEGDEKVLYFTGRAADFLTLNDSWSSHCVKNDVVLLTGDDVTNILSEKIQRARENGSEHGLNVRFVALMDLRRSSSTSARRTPHGQTFEKEYRSKVGGSIPLALDRARLAYDMTLAVTEAFAKFQAQGGGSILRSGVHYNLRGLDIEGATGTIAFSEDAVDHDALRRPLWLMSVTPGRDDITPHLRCVPDQDYPDCTTP